MSKTLLAAVGLVMALGGNAIAQDSFFIVEGRTNSGNRLGLNRNSVELDADQGLYRYFGYYIITKEVDVRHNIGKTSWCRHGKVQLDKRTIAGGGSFTSKEYVQMALSKRGGWIAINEERTLYVDADSPASQNLLRQVCKAKAERGAARGLFD